jgi:hypothetical protein
MKFLSREETSLCRPKFHSSTVDLTIFLCGTSTCLSFRLSGWRVLQESMSYPRICRIQPDFDAEHIADVPAEVSRQIAGLKLENCLKPGDTVAVTAGSGGSPISPLLQFREASPGTKIRA